MASDVLREVSGVDFDQVVSRTQGPVLAEFFATWCGACQRLAPVLDNVASEFAGRVQAVKLDVDGNSLVVDRYAVSSTPTLVLFGSGQPVARLVGAQGETSLREWLEQALAQHSQVPGSWAPVDACTLPTEAQPLRVAEFGDLFAFSVRGMVRVSATLLRLDLDPAAEDAARDLVARESECCGFFSFTFSPADADVLRLDVGVPVSRVDVLDGLAAQAQAARVA